ncbi:hypothetical protein TNCV_2280971 [Trichonephila clavipes]|nr:hypothetical protein TNCV_2280971 [Trichonephila clavipes]
MSKRNSLASAADGADPASRVHETPARFADALSTGAAAQPSPQDPAESGPAAGAVAGQVEAVSPVQAPLQTPQLHSKVVARETKTRQLGIISPY